MKDEREGEDNHPKGRKRRLESHDDEGRTKYYKDDDVDFDELRAREVTFIKILIHIFVLRLE